MSYGVNLKSSVQVDVKEKSIVKFCPSGETMLLACEPCGSHPVPVLFLFKQHCHIVFSTPSRTHKKLFFTFEKRAVLAFNSSNLCRGENNMDAAF